MMVMASCPCVLNCVCSAAGDCVLVMAMVRFDVKNAIGRKIRVLYPLGSCSN